MRGSRGRYLIVCRISSHQRGEESRTRLRVVIWLRSAWISRRVEPLTETKNISGTPSNRLPQSFTINPVGLGDFFFLIWVFRESKLGSVCPRHARWVYHRTRGIKIAPPTQKERFIGDSTQRRDWRIISLIHAIWWRGLALLKFWVPINRLFPLMHHTGRPIAHIKAIIPRSLRCVEYFGKTYWVKWCTS